MQEKKISRKPRWPYCAQRVYLTHNTHFLTASSPLPASMKLTFFTNTGDSFFLELPSEMTLADTREVLASDVRPFSLPAALVPCLPPLPHTCSTANDYIMHAIVGSIYRVASHRANKSGSFKEPKSARHRRRALRDWRSLDGGRRYWSPSVGREGESRFMPFALNPQGDEGERALKRLHCFRCIPI
jgi:hypothetical protein